ncbi:hypothetical protein DRI50_01965 [candidate division KSB1 bacterium]|nr:MAG: hypothetical protein DRI50_01965 [candidate division KSB1 bacterium]
MGEVSGINDIIRRIETLDANIELDAQTLPLVHDLIGFIKDIIPLMLEINAFMRDGSQKIPSASNNLQFVSKTTEMATHEILDQLELVTQKVNEIKEELNKEGNSEKILKHIESLEKKTSDIFLSFQFQDITNQQLEYVNRILQAIYQKFIELFDTSLKVRARTLFGQDLILAIEKELQKRNGENALQKFNNVTTDIVRHNGVSQEAIDKYFTEK